MEALGLSGERRDIVLKLRHPLAQIGILASHGVLRLVCAHSRRLQPRRENASGRASAVSTLNTDAIKSGAMDCLEAAPRQEQSTASVAAHA
jgi:hypothetical protein